MKTLLWGLPGLACMAAGLAVRPPAPAAAERPHVLLLLTDDQRPDTIRALGNPLLPTPNLDRLAREGAAFSRAVSPNPLCVPSRKEILSGCSGIRGGAVNFGPAFDPDQTPLPRLLRAAGYRTWHVGKWHTEKRPRDAGFEESLALYMGGGGRIEAVDHAGRPVTGYNGWVLQTDDGRKFPGKGVGLTPDISRVFADAAIEFIERRPAEPFFLHVCFTAPHDPLLLPSGYETMFDPAAIPLPPNFLPEHPFDHGNLKGRDEMLFAWPRTPEETRREIAAYYAVLAHLDGQIGRILAALDATGQAARTVVIFTSDHGLAVGSHGLRGKQNMYEHTVGVPLIVRGPDVPAGVRRAAQCYLRDLYPTICELAGAAVPPVVQAKSLLPALRDGGHVLYPEVFGYFRSSQRMIRTDRWKLVCYPEAGRRQLFDLAADPFEMNDLSEAPRHADVLAGLQARLRAWQQAAGDPLAQ